MSWSKDYKKSIDCSNPKGFSQKAHCDGRKARQRGEKTKSKSPFKEQDMKLQEVELFLEENCPTDPSKWSYYKSQAKKKFDVYPSAYANAWAAKQYKGAGGGWKKCPKKESIDESTLSQIHNAAKKGSYPVTLVAIEDGFKVVSQEIVKTPMAVPAAFRMMQGAHPRAKIHVEDKTGKILFREFQRDRQLRNPSKEMMVVKDGEVVVIDKKDWKKYKSKGYMVAESVNEAVKKGKKYGDWTVTQYEPVEYDDYGAPNGGRIKIVNQKTGNDLLIQNDLALRGSKWYVSVNRRTIKDTNPEKVIQQAIKNSVNEGKITKTFKFPRKTSTDMDEIDADFSRQGIKSNPDFNNNTITVTGDESKINKIVKFHRGIEESTDSVYESIQEGLMQLGQVLSNPYHTAFKPMVEEDEIDDPQELLVGDYQTRHFDMCPGATAVYKDIENKGVDMDLAERTARLQDVLFYMEKHTVKEMESATKEDVLMAKNLANQIMRMADMMGLRSEHNYIQGHVDAIENVAEKGNDELQEGTRSGMDIIRRIVKNHQYESGVDVQTANMILNAYNKVDSKTQKFMDHSTLKQLVDLFMRARKR